MKSNNTAFKPTEPYYRPGQMIEEKSTAPKGVGTKDLQFEVRSPANGHKCEKSVPMSKKKSPGKFIEESIEDLLDEDEKFPVKMPEPSKEVRAEQPSKDEEPEQASPVITKSKETKPVETLPMIKDQRRQSQEQISPIQKEVNTKHPLAFVKSDKDLRGNASVVSEKSKGEIRQSTPILVEQHKTLSASSLSTSNNFGMYGKLIATSANGMTEAELVAENKLLRHFLRDLNDILNQQVGKIKVEEDHDNRKVEFKNKSPEEQMRTIVKEIANNEKIMAYNKEENRKTEAKLNRIKDPLYLLNIQQEIETVQAKVDEMKRDNRKLMHSNGNIGKDLDMIENVKGVPQALEETREKQVEIKKLTKKLEGLIQKNLDMDQEKEQKLDKKESLVTEIKKLQREEEAFNSEASITRASRLKYMLLMAEETYKSLSKRYRMKKINVERELEQMIVENHKGKEHIERLDDIIKEQNAMLKGMISSERGKYSKPAQEVLDKMRLSIEYDESKQKWGSSNYLDDDKLEALKVVPNRPVKSKSIERGGGRIKRDLFDLQDDRRVHQSFSKHKPAIKRELIGAKASIWKETVVGDRARMEEILNMSPSRKYQHEDPVYMKPIGNKKSYGFVASAKNSEEGDVRGTPMFNGGAKVKPLGQSGSVKQLGTKGVSVPSPNESRLKPRGKEWHGINEENGLDNSWGDSSARKKQQQSKGNILDNSHSKGGRESEVETAKPIVKTKKRSQLEQIVMDDIKKGTAKFKSVEDDDSIVKGNQGVKKPEQPDNSQKVEKVQKRGNTTKGSDVTKVKNSMAADFEELEFDD